MSDDDDNGDNDNDYSNGSDTDSGDGAGDAEGDDYGDGSMKTSEDVFMSGGANNGGDDGDADLNVVVKKGWSGFWPLMTLLCILGLIALYVLWQKCKSDKGSAPMPMPAPPTPNPAVISGMTNVSPSKMASNGNGSSSGNGNGKVSMQITNAPELPPENPSDKSMMSDRFIDQEDNQMANNSMQPMANSLEQFRNFGRRM